MTIKIEEKFKKDFICNYRNDLDIIKVKASLSFRENYSEIREYRDSICKLKNKKHVFAFTFACLFIMCVVMISTIEMPKLCNHGTFYEEVISKEEVQTKYGVERLLYEKYNIKYVNAYGVISNTKAFKEFLPKTLGNYEFSNDINYSFAYISDNDIEYLAIYNITRRKLVSLLEITDIFKSNDLLKYIEEKANYQFTPYILNDLFENDRKDIPSGVYFNFFEGKDGHMYMCSVSYIEGVIYEIHVDSNFRFTGGEVGYYK